MRFVDQFVRDQQITDAADPRPRGSVEERLDARMKSAAVDWAADHPTRVLQLVWAKLTRMWSALPNAAEMQSTLFRLAILGSFVPVVALTIVSLSRSESLDWPRVFCLMPAIYLTCLHVIFVSSIRYREPAMLPLIAIAAGAFWPRRDP